MRIRRRRGEPDVLEVLQVELRRQRRLIDAELATVRAAHAEEATPPSSTLLPPPRSQQWRKK